MPLREFESVLKAKHDPPGGQPKVPDFSSAPSSFLSRSPEHDFVELLWENGHVVMQGQSNRPPKRSSSFFPGSVPSLIGGGGGGKSKEKEAKDHAAVAAKSGGRYHHHVLSSADALGRGDLTGPSGQALQLDGGGGGGGSGQEDDLVPWLNCPLDDYCSEFLSEFSSGVNPAASLVPADRISCFGQAPRDSEVSRYPHSNPYHQLFQLPQQYHNLGSSTATRPKEPDLMTGAADSPAPAKVLIKQDLTTPPPSKPMHPSNNNSNGAGSARTTVPVMNFSHFSRPVALVKANLLSVDRGVIRGIVDQKATSTAAAASSNPLESTVIESAGGFKNASASSHDDRHLDLVSAEAKSNPPAQPPSEETAAGQPAAETTTIRLQEKAAACRNSRNHKKSDSPSNGKAAPAAADYSSICHDSNFKAAGVHESTEINHREPAIASSSVCSAIGGAASPATNDHRNRPKWNKCPEGEEYSECPSEQDHEDDSADVRRSVTDKLGTSKKRSRAAEVHNLSERRRRDRINEKMRALQELIPNCNKVDKASMLDEAIEYLKTLQMQVQIMSMGGGLCMPPMMLPSGMQSMRPPHHMGPFSPMAVGMGMGMGMGFGMGMLDMSRPPLMPIPRMHAGLQYPCAAASMPAAAGLHGMRGSAANLHMFGIPMPHPPPPFVPLTGMPTSANQPAAAATAAEAAPVQASADHSAPPSSQQDRQLSTLEQVAKTSADNTPAEAPRQANRECFELPSIVRMDNQQPPNVRGNCEAISSGDGMHLPP